MEDDLLSVPMSTLMERMSIALAYRQSIAKPGEEISQAALSRACGVKPPSVNNWFSGKTKSLEGANLTRAAAYFGVRPTWLAEGKGAMRYDHDTDEWRQIQAEMEDFDGNNLSPMAKKLAREFDQIEGEAAQLDVLVACISLISKHKTAG